MSALESDLRRLPEPALPEGVSATIIARIGRLREERPAGAGEPPRAAEAGTGLDRLAWTLALMGATASLGAEAYRLVVGEATLDLITPRIGAGLSGAVAMLPASPAVAVLAAGLLLYLAGLFR